LDFLDLEPMSTTTNRQDVPPALDFEELPW
jgi:hypothetical protein